MTEVLDIAARLARLAIVLELRESLVAPVLAAAAIASGGKRPILVGVSAHGRRVDVVLPWSAEAFTGLGGSLETLQMTVTGPPSGLRVRVDGDQVATALLSQNGARDPRGAVDELAPPAARDAWFEYVEQFCAIASARINGKTRWLDGRVALEIRYPARASDSKAELYLLAAIDQLGEQLGVTAAQRTLWQQIHARFGGVEMALTTGCTSTGAVSHTLALGYPETSWERAMHMAEGTTLDAAEASKIPRQLGALAGALASDALQSIELELGPHEPLDVIVWAKLAPA